MMAFDDREMAMMLESVREGHSGTFWTFGPHYGSVAVSSLEQVIPHETSRDFNQWAWGRDLYSVKFRRNLPPVFTPFIDLGLEKVKAYGCGKIVPRQGTTIWGDLVPFPWPWMVSWRFGGDGGMSWVAADDLDHPWWSKETYGFSENKFAVDVLANLVAHSVGRELPEDIMVPMRIRDEFFTYVSGRNLLVSILEFAEKFGADTSRLYEDLLTIDGSIVAMARDSYLDQEYGEALSGIMLGNEEIEGLVEKGLKARERALFWIFLVEWFVVSGASMLSGFALWTLMIRRRVYRDVITTRLIQR
jgi:hypothetical protein